MRRTVLAALCGLSLVPATAHAGELRDRYSALWHACADKPSSVCSPGRNIRRHGLRTGHGPRRARAADYRRSIAALDGWLHPVAPAPVLTSPVPPQSGPVAVQAAYSGGMPDCTWKPESGGSYTARNASGAGGKYQIMPGTWKANGGTGANAADAPPAEQEAVARRVMATQGPSAWVNC